MTAPYRPLAQLLVDSVRSADGSGGREALDPALRELDLSTVVAAGRLHRVTPAVAAYLARLDGVPAHWRGPLDWLRRSQLIRHLKLRADLAGLQDVLDRIGLGWVLVKGPAAADLLWPRPDLREYYDLDLVVERHRFGAAVDSLDKEGYRLVDRNWPELRHGMRAELAFESPAGSSVDLHWHIAVPRRLRSAFRFDVAGMLGRRRPAVLGDGLRTWVLDPADTVLHLAFHAAQDGLSRLVWAADVWFALRRLAPEDWLLLGERARRAKAELPLALVLRRSTSVLGRPPGFDDRLLLPARGVWGRWVAARDRRHPFPGLPGDEHLGGTLYTSARRHLVPSLRHVARSRWHLRSTQSPDRATDSETEVLARNVPNPLARAAYLRRTETSRRP